MPIAGQRALRIAQIGAIGIALRVADLIIGVGQLAG